MSYQCLLDNIPSPPFNLICCHLSAQCAVHIEKSLLFISYRSEVSKIFTPNFPSLVQRGAIHQRLNTVVSQGRLSFRFRFKIQIKGENKLHISGILPPPQSLCKIFVCLHFRQCFDCMLTVILALNLSEYQREIYFISRVFFIL